MVICSCINDYSEGSAVANGAFYHTTSPDSRGLRLGARVSGWLRCEASNNVGKTSQSIRIAVSGMHSTHMCNQSPTMSVFLKGD